MPPIRICVPSEGRWRRADFAAYSDYPPEAARKAELFSHQELKYSSYWKSGECPYLKHCPVFPMSIGYHPGNTDPHRVPDFICAFNRVALKHRERFWERSPKPPTWVEWLEQKG